MKPINKKIIKMVACFVALVLVGMGNALGMKAAIGVSAWDGFGQAISLAVGIKVGTVAMLMHSSFILVQIAILKSEFKLARLSQLILACLIGYVINFFYYNVFSLFYLHHYWEQLACLMVAYLLMAFFTGLVMNLNIITFPLESAIMELCNQKGYHFGKLRQLADIILIGLAVVISFMSKTQFTIREGTFIGMLLLGPLMDFFMKLQRKYLNKILG